MFGHRRTVSEPENLVLQPRGVTFDWTELPTHWVPDEPLVTHTCNVLHLLLPEGERWFIDAFTQAIPLIKEDTLREDVLGFIGQESIHARSHQGVLDHWKAKGIDTDPYVQQVGWMFQKVLGDRDLPAKRREQWLIERLAIIAAIPAAPTDPACRSRPESRGGRDPRRGAGRPQLPAGRRFGCGVAELAAG